MSITLVSGSKMPLVGLGLWKSAPGQLSSVIPAAINAGYRLFDSASDYGNERETGEALKAALASNPSIKREDLFITSKLWNTDHHVDHVEPALNRIMSDLQVDYLDLFLIHFPISLKYVDPKVRYPAGWSESGNPQQHELSKDSLCDTWRAMEKLVDSGKVRNIGVSNFNCQLLQEILRIARIKPAVNQIESHPFLNQSKLIKFCQSQNIAVTAFSPLGATSYRELTTKEHPDLFTHPVIIKIAADLNKTPAQVLIRFQIERGVAAIPKTTSNERLKDNIDVLSFKLSSSQLDEMLTLNQNLRFNDPGEFANIEIYG